MQPQLSTTPAFVREPLQMLQVDAICYGAKDTGEMGGGAAAAVLAAAGPQILPALRAELAKVPRIVGTVVATDSFGLRATGILWVLHLISIIKNTPEGAWCPQHDHLRDGVAAAMHAASKLGARSIGFSALGTGEGRVTPLDAARLMLAGVQEFRRREPRSALAVTFALPSFGDYEAFVAVRGR